MKLEHIPVCAESIHECRGQGQVVGCGHGEQETIGMFFFVLV